MIAFIKEISKYGHLLLDLSHAQVLAQFAYGDRITVAFGRLSLEMPVCSAYTGVEAGALGLFLQVDHGREEVKIALNVGSFAEEYGIAYRPNPAALKAWVYTDGFSAAMPVALTLREAGGYLAEYRLRNREYTDARSDYPWLSDAAFANFRAVAVGDIRRGVLYRMASPIDPTHGRAAYADAAAKAAKITHFLDLTDGEETVSARAGYPNSYFATQSHTAIAVTMDFTARENREKLASGLRYMAAHRGVYGVFCKEGKDRTGFVLALLECFMGAPLSAVVEDYMTTFYNYYGITAADAAYAPIWQGNIAKTLQKVLGVDPYTANLRAAAEHYLAEIGLSDGERAALRAALSR